MTDKLPSIEDLLKARQSSNAVSSISDEDKNSETSDENKIKDESQETVVTPAPPGASSINVSGDSENNALDDKMQELRTGSKEKETEEQASLLGVPYIDLKGFPISPDALRLIPEEQASAEQVVVFFHNGPQMRLGAVRPKAQQVSDLAFQLAERHKTQVEIYQISDNSLHEALKLYRAIPKIKKIVKGVQIKEEELKRYQEEMDSFEDISNVLKNASITDILAILIAAALKLGSSDIHIEAEEKGIMVRFRVDGVLQEVAILEKNDWKKIISRIKLIASLKLNINDKPQDGRFTIFQKDVKIDVRTSTIPTAWGESVVMRILNPESIQLEFEQLGFRKATLERLMPEIQKPNGMIITTGPTGSGKTTTLYSILRKLNQPDVKIITLEDPVEYKLEGINQSQIDHSRHYTFSDGLRSILRQDPDIVMVGEIRDLETAEAAIQASLTGHLLLSTIHTNDAAGAIPRFISMGVQPFLLAPAISVIMGQRLLRRLCSKCKQPAELDDATLRAVNSSLEAIPDNSGETVPTERTFYKPVGCPACNETGYKGRVGVYEVLIKNKKIEEFILSGEVSEYKMREVASEQGMVSMTQDGLLKALEGLTSVEEVRRVTGL